MALSLDGENRRRVADDVRFLTGSGVPTNGTSGTGAGVAGPSSFFFDVTNAIVYVNTNTKASPTWVVFGISNIGVGDIVTAMLADLSVTTAKLANLAVTTGKIAAGAVTANEIDASAVGTSELAANAVTTAKILDLNVTTAKIALLAITAALIAPNAVTAATTAGPVFKQSTGTISAVDMVGTGAGQFGHANGFPITVPPGATDCLELISVVAIYDFSVAAYTAGGNTTVNRSGGGGALTGLISAANFAGAAADRITLFYPLTTAGVNLVANEGFNLVTSAAFTQPGTAAGVIRYIANYRQHVTGL